MSHTVTGPVLDVSEEEINRDVFGFLARMRREMPIAYVPAVHSWILTRWSDIHEVLKNPESFRAKPTYLYMPAVGGEYLSTVGDGEEHERLRCGVDESLAPRMVEKWGDGVIDPAVDDLLETLRPVGRGDLLDDLMGPVSMRVLLHTVGLEGLPPETFQRWYDGIADGFTNFAADPARQDRSWALSKEIDAYCEPIMREKDARPDDTMMSHLMKHALGESFGERFAFVMPTIKATIFAGGQEPAHGAVNTLIGILGDEETRARFAADPRGLVKQASEEGLRWLPPLIAFLRRVLRTTEVGGVELPKGAEMMVSLASANRDETIWGDDAERFDLDRFAPGKRGRHVSFGLHPHFCPGNWLVRATIRRSLPRIFDSLPNLRIDPERPPVVGGNILVNAPHLHCVWDA